MTQRLNDFLAREAGDYLSRMTRLLTASGRPDPAELSRLAHGVRGSAQMAGAAEIAELAERLERQLRGLAAGEAEWEEGVRERLLRDIASLEDLLATGASPIIPISDLFHDDDGPHVIPAPAGSASDAGVPDIDQFLYAGSAALSAAASLRPGLSAAVDEGDPDRTRALLDELFDLIRLAGSPAP